MTSNHEHNGTNAVPGEIVPHVPILPTKALQPLTVQMAEDIENDHPIVHDFIRRHEPLVGATFIPD